MVMASSCTAQYNLIDEFNLGINKMIICSYMNNKYFIAITTSLILGTWAIPAYAYLDPGTGSMLIQGILGAIAAVGVALKLYWHKIKLMISGRRTGDETTNKSQDSATKK